MMHIFTQSIAFTAGNDNHRSSVVSFLTCLRYIFNSSVIPEILSNSDNQHLYKNLVIDDEEGGSSAWFRLFLQSNTMQFASMLVIPGTYTSMSASAGASFPSLLSDCDDDGDDNEDDENTDNDDDVDDDDDDNDDDAAVDCDDDDDDDDENLSDAFVEEILLPLKKNMKYFSCTLQRCIVHDRDLCGDKDGLLAILADVRSLTHLELHYCQIDIDQFLSLFLASSSSNQLEFLYIALQYDDPEDEEDDDEPLPEGIEGRSFQRLRDVTLKNVHSSFAVKLLRHCPNLGSLEFEGQWEEPEELATLCPKLSAVKLDALIYDASELPQLTGNLPQLTSLDLARGMDNDNCLKSFDLLNAAWLPGQLRVLKLSMDSQLASPRRQPASFDFGHIGQLRSLAVLHLPSFDKDLTDKDMHHFANLVSLRYLDISGSKITSNGLVDITKNASSPGSFLPQLVGLTLNGCKLGGKAKSPKNLITFFSFCLTNLKKVSLGATDITNDDLSAELVAHWKRCGIESLNLSGNKNLDDNKKSGLVNLKQLTSLTHLNISHLDKVTHLDFVSSMQKLRDLNASFMSKLKPAAVAVFSQAPDSFSDLRTLNLQCSCEKQRGGKVDKVVELLLKNDNIKYRLEELRCSGVPEPKDYEFPDEEFHVAKIFN